jgi:hypothetical protein
LPFWSAALSRRFTSTNRFAFEMLNSGAMSQRPLAWLHAPTHELSTAGTYFVTAATYLKKHHFRTRASLDWLQHELLSAACEFGWRLERWAVFSNHYATDGIGSGGSPTPPTHDVNLAYDPSPVNVWALEDIASLNGGSVNRRHLPSQ